jgi:hypothetical protein
MTTITRNHTLEFTLDGVPELTLHNHRGDLQVLHDAAPGEVRITLTSSQPVDVDLVESRVDGTRVAVTIPRLPAEGASGLSFSLGALSFAVGGGPRVDVDVHCPPEAALALETKYGDIDIRGRSGKATAKTGAGELVAEDCVDAVFATGAGDIRLSRVGSAKLNTGAGDISVEDASGRLDVRTGAGDVHIGSSKGQLAINVGAGDVHAAVDEGSAEVRTGMGDVNVQVPSNVPVWQDLTTGMGEARSHVPSHGEPEPGEPFVKVVAHSGAGDVTLTV